MQVKHKCQEFLYVHAAIVDKAVDYHMRLPGSLAFKERPECGE